MYIYRQQAQACPLGRARPIMAGKTFTDTVVTHDDMKERNTYMHLHSLTAAIIVKYSHQLLVKFKCSYFHHRETKLIVKGRHTCACRFDLWPARWSWVSSSCGLVILGVPARWPSTRRVFKLHSHPVSLHALCIRSISTDFPIRSRLAEMGNSWCFCLLVLCTAVN